jgi:hypothetical protein
VRVHAAALGFALLSAAFVAPVAAQEAAEQGNRLASPIPNFTLAEVVDSLTGPDGRLMMGDAEYFVDTDAQAKGGVGIYVRPWPGGVVPYVLDASLTPDMRQRFEQAIQRWESVAPVDFVPRSNQTNYVLVRRSDTGNSSCVGMCNPGQILQFQPDVPVGVVLHELGHALGMNHEHVRSDRDRYVEVRSGNIMNDFVHNFRLVQTQNCSQYDFGSIMHYGRTFFTTNGQPTLVPHPKYSSYAQLMGSRSDLSESDILDVRAVYGGAPCNPPGGPSPDRRPAESAVNLDLTGSIGHQRVIFGPDFDVPGLRDAWSEGLDFVTGAQGPQGTVLVAARGNSTAQQQVSFNTAEWPGEHVREYWDEEPDYTISGVFAGPQGWTVIMSRVSDVYTAAHGQSLDNWGWGSQSWRLRDNWERDVIRELWDDGKLLTDVAYGPDGWMLVGTSGTGWGAQGWDVREDPREIIRERWDDGYSITDLAFGQGNWHLVATKDAGIGMQRWVRSETFPEDQIRQAWNDGMHIQAIDYGAGWWYVVFSQRQ